MKIRHKIQITGIIIVSIVTLLSIGCIYFFAVLNIKTSINRHMESLTESSAQQVKIYLNGMENLVLDFSKDESTSTCLADITDLNSGSCTSQQASANLRDKLTTAKELNNISLLDENLNIVSSTNDGLVGDNIEDKVTFIKGEQSSYVSEVFFSDEEKTQTAINIASPILYGKEEIGYILAEVDMSELNGILSDIMALDDNMDVYLTDESGTILTPSKFNSSTALKVTINNSNVRECVESLTGYLEDDGTVEEHQETIHNYTAFTGERVVGTHSYVEEQNWCLIMESNESELYEILSPIIYFLLGLAVLIFMVFLIASTVISRKITKPLNELKQEVDHVAEGYYKHKFRMSHYYEYDQLSKSIDKLVEILYDFRDKDKKNKM